MSQEVRHRQCEYNQSIVLILVLPERVGDYYNLVPLDANQANISHQSNTFRYQTISYKATHIRTNSVYYLKRIMGIYRRAEVVVYLWFVFVIKVVNYLQDVCSILSKHGRRLFMPILFNCVKSF